jgi:hypothetical protein
LEETTGHEKCTQLLVEIVEMSVKSHLSQDKIDQFIVMIVFQSINQQEATVVEVDLDVVADLDLVVEVEEDMVVEMIEVEEDLVIEDHEKCTQLLVEIVEMSVKSHLSQKMVGQSIVTNASQITETREEIRIEI